MKNQKNCTLFFIFLLVFVNFSFVYASKSSSLHSKQETEQLLLLENAQEAQRLNIRSYLRTEIELTRMPTSVGKPNYSVSGVS